MSPPISPFDRVNAALILGSLACIAFYVVALAWAGADAEAQLEQARRERAHFERLCEEKDHQMNGALEEIHKLRGDDAAG